MKTLVTLAIVALFAATAARAEVITKGGAMGLRNPPPVQSPITATVPMSCPKCKTEFVPVTVPRSRATPPSTVLVARHACPSCVNEWVTIGHGKAKVLTSVHTCGGCKS